MGTWVSACHCGVLLRGYTNKPEEVQEVVDRLFAMIQRAIELKFHHVVAVIPREKDCGETALALGRMVAESGYQTGGRISVLTAAGDPNSDALNTGVSVLRKHDCYHALIISNKSLPFFTEANMEKMIAAIGKGAFVSGLALSDIRNSVLVGRLSNTAALWEIDTLLASGGFTSKQGVEEIYPMCDMVSRHGKCLAPVLPIEDKDFALRTDGEEHHQKVVDSKTVRQEEEARRYGVTLDHLYGGIMSGYPR